MSTISQHTPNLNIKSNQKIQPILAGFFETRGQGFEPRLAGPKPAVLPLDDPRILNTKITKTKTSFGALIFQYSSLNYF